MLESMKTRRLPGISLAVAFLMFFTRFDARTGTFTVATYNVENYLDTPTATRSVKPAASKTKVREIIQLMAPDVLALQEMGTTNALLELRDSLKAQGLHYPHWEHVTGFDTNIFVAVLSRFPFVARRPTTNAGFLLRGRRFTISRGFAQLDIKAAPRYTFTLLTAHLKSRRTSPEADEGELRLHEARLLRQQIDALLGANPSVNLVVLGDFNDSKASPALKAIIGRGKSALIDTRPAERNGDTRRSGGASSYVAQRKITWTHFYAKEDVYQRPDYILLSSGMAREWDVTGTHVVAVPDWGLASDHRPIIARFFAEDR